MTTATTGQAIRRLRELSGLTLDQVAALASVSPAYLSRVETGQCAPSIKWIATVSSALASAISDRADGVTSGRLSA